MKERYYSLDVFRGATVALMILVNNPGDWGHIYWPLEHAAWHGLTPTDLVFPFFLFAVGNAMSFVMPGMHAAGTNLFFKKVIKRTLLIFIIGFLMSWFPFVKWQNDALVLKGWTWVNADKTTGGVRILGVLGRIALSYFFASLIIYFFKTKTIIIITALLLSGYWALCFFLGAKGDSYSITGFFGTGLDLKILGDAHMYHGEGMAFDPEGIASTMAAIPQVILGYFAGKFIRENGKNYTMATRLLLAGFILFAIGIAWSYRFPVNKKIWTSSYTLVTTGLATLFLVLFIYLLEFKNLKGWWSSFFNVFGKNPLFIFVLSGLIPRLTGLIRIAGSTDKAGKPIYLSPLGWFFEHVCKPLTHFNLAADVYNASLLFAIIMIMFYWLIGFVMDKNKIYVKV